MDTTITSILLNASLFKLQSTEDMVSYSFYILMNTIMNKYTGVVISLVGLVTNVVSCVVFWRQGLRDRVNLCLFSLALVDLLAFLQTLMTPCVNFFIDFWDPLVGDEFVFKSLAYTLGVVYGLRATSDIISMIIAVDRCLCVLLPLRVTHLIRTRTMAAMMAASFVFLQLSYVVFPLSFTVARVYINSTGIFDWKIMPTEIGVKYANILDAVSNALLSISLPVITFIIVFLATAMTVMKLSSATRWREQTSSATSGSRDRQAAATKMLVLVSSLYIVTMAPSVACIITQFIIRDFSPYGRYYYGYMSVALITEKMSWINNAVNFFVYLAQSSRFRQDLIKCLCCGQKRKPPVYLTSSLTTAVSSKQ